MSFVVDPKRETSLDTSQQLHITRRQPSTESLLISQPRVCMQETTGILK